MKLAPHVVLTSSAVADLDRLEPGERADVLDRLGGVEDASTEVSLDQVLSAPGLENEYRALQVGRLAVIYRPATATEADRFFPVKDEESGGLIVLSVLPLESVPRSGDSARP